MHDDKRAVIGIRLRSESGTKNCVPGSRTGLFIPRALDSKATIVAVCEGPTDTAAAMTLGFEAVGRPSCSGGVELLLRVMQAWRRRPVVIVSDADDVGRIGSSRLAACLSGVVDQVRVIVPPPPHKDLRAWMNAGAKQRDVWSAPSV